MWLVQFLVTIFCLFVGYENSPYPLCTYDDLLQSVTQGMKVNYFFNTTLCEVPSGTSPTVFGGKIQYFEAIAATKFDKGKIIFTQQQYVQEKWRDDAGVYNQDMKDISIYPDRPVQILLDRPTVNLNDTRGLRQARCQWNQSHQGDTIFFYEHFEPAPHILTGFYDLQSSLMKGEEIRMIVNTTGCNCTYNDCRNLTFGGNVNDFQFDSNDLITFSLYKPMFLGVPFDHPMFYRDITFGYIYSNGTTKFTYTYLDPMNWFILDQINISCPIATKEKQDGASKFYKYVSE